MGITALIAASAGQQALSEPKAPCWRCQGHGCVEIYSISDEYAAPCPACKGVDAYHAKIERREGFVPSSLRWPQAQPAALSPETDR